MIRYYAETRRSRRAENQDRIFIDGKVLLDNSSAEGVINGQFLCAVIDGVGGCKNGSIAADITADRLQKSSPSDSIELVEKLLYYINDQLLGLNCDAKAVIAGVSVVEDVFLTYNCGDSTVLLYRASEVSLLSEEHTVEKELSVKGASNILTRCLGSQNFVPYVAKRYRRLITSDMLLLMTDGVHGSLTYEMIQQVLSEADSISRAAGRLLDLAEDKSNDNLSIIILNLV